MTKPTVEGFAQPRFGAVKDVFAENLQSGADVGASFCATLEGQTVVDIWGGFADEARTRPWQKDTIVNVYSSTKTMTALVALILADRGLLRFEDPVAKYWPEFAAAGKERVTVAHLMSHSSGLSGWKEPIAPGDIYDWDKVCALLAAQEPFWEPGTASGYHGLTQGYLVGEVVRRITGQSLGTFFRKEIAEPLGADFHIGMGPEHDDRVADLIPPPLPDPSVPQPEPSALMMNLVTNPPTNPLDTRTRAWRAAEIPAAGGQGNARSLAEIHTILANGGVAKGKRFLSEAGCRKALELQVSGTDLVLGMPARFGLGFGVPDSFIPVANPNTIFWGGYGGSLIVIDMDARTTFGYAMNKMAITTIGDARSLGMIEVMWKALAA